MKHVQLCLDQTYIISFSCFSPSQQEQAEHPLILKWSAWEVFGLHVMNRGKNETMWSWAVPISEKLKVVNFRAALGFKRIVMTFLSSCVLVFYSLYFCICLKKICAKIPFFYNKQCNHWNKKILCIPPVLGQIDLCQKFIDKNQNHQYLKLFKIKKMFSF